MDLARLLAYFEASAAVRLLRSPNAPFVLDFLHRQYKRGRRIAVPHGELRGALAAYLDEVHPAHPGVMRDAPEAYLAGWCGSETRWLRRLLEAGRDEPVYQLTPDVEEVFAFLDRALDRQAGFVAAESRLKMVTAALCDLAAHAAGDPETRLLALRAERQRLDEEIRQAEGGDEAGRYQPAQVRERFATAVTLLKQLQGDFRAVEEKFRAITRQVQQRQSEGRDTRGGILGFALDAEEVLLREDQGVSFSEFVRFLLDPDEQQRLRDAVGRVERLEEAAGQPDALEAVRGMVPALLAEAENVMRTNQRLSATLRRLLDPRGRSDRQRVGQLCRDILALGGAAAGPAVRGRVGLDVDVKVAVSSPLSRTFWQAPPRFGVVAMAEHAGDEGRRGEAARLLGRMQRLDWRRMRENVRESLARHGSVTLARLLEAHPAAAACEVLAYVQIAHDDGHFVSPAAREDILLPPPADGGRPVALSVPLVRFVAP
jgi:hypothetical protein